MGNPHYLYLDTETGGDNPLTDALLTVGMVAERNGEVLGVLHLKVQSEGLPVKEAALACNKINIEEHDKIAITRREAASEIKRFVYKHFGHTKANLPVPVGQNVTFDLGFLRKLFDDCEMLAPYQYRSLDTMDVAFFLSDAGFLDLTKWNLDALMEHFGVTIPEEERHSALADCIATRSVYRAMVEHFSKSAQVFVKGTEKYGCNCDLDPEDEPDECYIDDGHPQDCSFSASGEIKDKTKCPHWVKFISYKQEA